MAERIETTNLKRNKTCGLSATLNKYAGVRAAIAAELMIGFWFGIGVILAVGVVDSLNHCVRAAITSSKLGNHH